MNLGNPVKRYFLALAFIAGAVTLWFAVPTEAGSLASPTPCPLPETASDTSKTQTAENPQPYMQVLHNPGMPSEKILCLPQSAADAHVRHGDTPMGPCDKPGNVK